MAIEITLSLPEGIVEDARRFGSVTRRELETVISDALEMMWPTLGDLPDQTDYPSMASLEDSEVLVQANAKMDPVQNQRLGMLQEKGKTVGLTADERYELLALMRIYQTGQLRKSEALAEVVRRGLLPPLSA